MESAGLLSLLPVVVAIGLALLTRRVVPSLGAGVLVAALLARWGDPLAGLWRAVTLVGESVGDWDHLKVTSFSLLVAAAVAVMGQAGGTRALVERVTAFAHDRRRAMGATWLAGMVVFFDDYANCLIVGGAMRPLTDRMRISREKLSYLVDSTAAPMATIALVSTWVGYEVGLMDDGLKAAGVQTSAYAFFVEGLPYRFYPFFTLAFAGAIAWSGRDFGPMLAAEERAAAHPPPDASDEPDVVPARIWIAVVPIVALVAGTAGSLLWQGLGASDPGARLFEIIGNADGYDAMLHGSLLAFGLAAVMSLALRATDVGGVARGAWAGVRSLADALVVLYLAWSLSAGIQELDAAGALVALLGDSVPVAALPTLVFLVAAAIAFATGTSFGTMGVLVPLVVQLAFTMSPEGGFLPLAASAAVLSGATWGDHCSPISDTTVLSAAGTRCDLDAHVRTQLPYAIAAGVVSIALGTVPAGFGLSPWLVLVAGILGSIATVYALGRVPAVRPAGEAARAAS